MTFQGNSSLFAYCSWLHHSVFGTATYWKIKVTDQWFDMINIGLFRSDLYGIKILRWEKIQCCSKFFLPKFFLCLGQTRRQDDYRGGTGTESTDFSVGWKIDGKNPWGGNLTEKIRGVEIWQKKSVGWKFDGKNPWGGKMTEKICEHKKLQKKYVMSKSRWNQICELKKLILDHQWQYVHFFLK